VLSDAINDVPSIADPVEVGRGGFATVHRATDLQAGRPVAVKLLSLRADDGDLRQFDRERESLALLSTHPNVVTLHRTGVTAGGVPYLIMELASGGSLADRVKADGPIPWAEAVDLAIPICEALAHANGNGIRHRDVKPQNILISAHGQPLLSDFGIARQTAGTETVTHRAKLSLSYASPEQIEGRELDDRTDVYSLGATLYTLIAGAPAFADTGGTGFLNTAKRILEDPPPELDASVPDEIRSAIAAAMAKSPANRPSIDEFRRALARELVLDRPPAGDALPAITRDFDRHQEIGALAASSPPIRSEDPVDATPAGASPTILASTTDTWSAADGAGDESPATGKTPRPVVALFRGRARLLSIAAIGLLVAIGLLTAAWAGWGGGPESGDTVAATGDEEDGLGSAEPATQRSTSPTSSGLGSTTPSASDSGGSSPGGPSSASTSPPTTTRPDRDRDGALDQDDNCPDSSNRDQADRDGDEAGDACDPDDDNDEVADEVDNCRVDANADQADVDDDGLGDACDDFPDRDGDGVIDTNDPCVASRGDPDADGDGIPDACDASPRGMEIVAVSARIDRVAILNQAYGDGEADMFGDLTVAGTKFGLPEIADQREVRPGNWLSDEVAVDDGNPLVRIRIWIRDEDDCFLCRDGLVDVTPAPGMNALQVVIDTSTGLVELASESWNRLEPVGTLSGPADGDLSGVLTLQGDDDGVHLASIEVTLTVVRQPVP